MSSSSGASAPVFSYAQAAKGLASAASTQSTSRNESPAASDKATKDKTAGDLSGASTALKSPVLGSQSESKASEDAVASSPGPSSLAKHGATQHAKDASATNSTQEPSNSTADTHEVEPKSTHSADVEKPANGLQESATVSADPESQVKAADDDGDAKAKDLEDDWEKVSVPSLPAESQYKAAPIPAVNVWQTRMASQAAKQKEPVVQQKPSIPAASAQAQKSYGNTEESKRKGAAKPASSELGSKNVEATKGASRKDMQPMHASGASFQSGDRARGANPPSVNDSQSWPTPETSANDDRRHSSSFERVDKQDAQKSHGGNKWERIAFVPTAKFETELPPRGGYRGRGGARGRDGTGRGGAHAGHSAEKQDAMSAMGPPPLPRQSGEQDRGRRSEGQRGARGASVPTSSTARPTTHEDNNLSHRKASNAKVRDQNTSNHQGTLIPSTQAPGDHGLPTEKSSRSSSRHTGKSGGITYNAERQTPTDQAVSTYGQPSDPSVRYGTIDRSKATAFTNRTSGDFARDRGTGRRKEWSQDKPESAREKVESWRDREPSGDSTGRRGGRGERGRGGYRGRGDHSFNPAYNSSHAYTAPLPQNGFEPSSRSTSNTEPRSRQTSQTFVPTQASSSARAANVRSQSIPVGPAYYNGIPNASQGLSTIQTDMSVYGYPSQMQMQPSIMSAMPYQDPLGQYALMSMVMTQIEYYFSIDNLCKDMYLRKHMDNQGYVPLSVIANFKRIKSLTEDSLTMDHLRYVCHQVKSIEVLPSADGEDRLRRRDGWRDFVLPFEDRFETARVDGPLQSPTSVGYAMQQEQQVYHNQAMNYGQLRSPPPTMGSFNGNLPTPTPISYFPGSQMENQAGGQQISQHEDISAQTGPRSPPAFFPGDRNAAVRSPPANVPSPLSNIVNGHRRQSSRADVEENSFPDDQIANINIRMRGSDDMQSSTAHISTESGANLPQGDHNGSHDVTQSRMPGLRGGAGSPQQLEQFRDLSVQGVKTIATGTGVIYFSRDGKPVEVTAPETGQFDQTYTSLRSLAFQQHQMGMEGALVPLYNFWVQFLVGNFNLSMYQEFKSLAMSEFRLGYSTGLSYLVRYYGKSLATSVPISERLAFDMVNLSREEKPESRAVFQTMRAAWRNGATNMKTIKRLGDVLTGEEKAELDKSG